MNPLGRLIPRDFKHVEKYPLSAVVIAGPALVVNKTLSLPSWHWTHDQGDEGSCVGHGSAMERAITNTAQNRLLAFLRPTVRYDTIDLWNEAKKVDEWPDTNPGDDNGTSVRAAYDVLRNEGPRRVSSMRLVDGIPTPYRQQPRDARDGVSVTRWARTVDEVRLAISQGKPVTIGVTWTVGYDAAALVQRSGTDWWIAAGAQSKSIRGGHCVCLYGASDRRQAFKLKNSWGRSYPLVWLPYSVMDAMLADEGEAALTTDL